MIRLREMSERIVVQTPITTADAAGGQGIVWQNLASLWAEVRPASATEGNRIGGTTTRRFLKIFIRERSDIALPIQVIWVGKTLRVLALRANGPGHTELECEEILQ
ncbi:MAG: hypothetical protein COA47_06460 [Robiginitomaculum sp.]|nr:MAG: hypothetical protein COA47_06460 [Robiginitomaculum sp.]